MLSLILFGCGAGLCKCIICFSFNLHNTSTLPFKGHFEIVSLVGTVDPDGQHHLHISISDADGNVFGGHVLSDHIIYTTGKDITKKLFLLSAVLTPLNILFLDLRFFVLSLQEKFFNRKIEC